MYIRNILVFIHPYNTNIILKIIQWHDILIFLFSGKHLKPQAFPGESRMNLKMHHFYRKSGQADSGNDDSELDAGLKSERL